MISCFYSKGTKLKRKWCTKGTCLYSLMLLIITHTLLIQEKRFFFWIQIINCITNINDARQNKHLISFLCILSSIYETKRSPMSDVIEVGNKYGYLIVFKWISMKKNIWRLHSRMRPQIAFADMHFEAVVYLRICNNDIIINTQTFCVIISSFLYVYKVYNICYCCYLVCFSRVFACLFYVM